MLKPTYFHRVNTSKKYLELDVKAHIYISRQAHLFELMLPKLLKTYSGQWILSEEKLTKYLLRR